MALRSQIKKGIACLTTIFMITTPTFAATLTDTTTKPLSLEYAVEMGINMDDVLPSYTRKVEYYKAGKTDIPDLANYSYQQANVYIEQYNTSKVYRKDVVRKNVVDSYQNIILLEQKIALGKTQIALQEKTIKQSAIKLKNGMCDQLTYDKQVQTLSDLKKQQEKNINDLAMSKTSFLKLTNLNLDKYTYEPDFTYEEFKLKDTPTAYASGMANELTKYQKKLAELSDEHFWDTIYNAGPGGTAPTYATYTQKKIDVENALAIVDSNYKSYKEAIESLYTTATNSLKDVEIKKAAYEAAQVDLKPLEIKHKAGYISDFDYEQQVASIESKRLEYLSAVYTYNSNKFTLEHPWTLSMFAY